MNEFIEKLIVRLEELSSKAEQNMNYYEEIAKEDVDAKTLYMQAQKKYNAFCEAISIVNQLAEEYNNESVKGDLISRNNLLQKFRINSDGRRIPEVDCDNHEITVSIKDIKRIIREQPTAYNDEWTLCNNGLPRSGVSVIVSYKDRFLAQADGTCEGWYDATNMIWHLTDYEYSDNVEVIAWRERLAPYQPKGE